MTDSISDLFTRIRNGYQARQKLILMPWSKKLATVAKILVREGYLKEATSQDEKTLRLVLKYENRQPVMSGIKRVSKPGRRLYLKSKAIKLVKSGLGISLISTPKGMMTGLQARQKNLGGEIIGEVW